MNDGPLELEKSAGPQVEVTGSEVKKEPPPDPAQVMKDVNELGEDLRALIVRVKRIPRDKAFDAHQDPARALALAQSNLQIGFMWLRRAIKPQSEF